MTLFLLVLAVLAGVVLALWWCSTSCDQGVLSAPIAFPQVSDPRSLVVFYRARGPPGQLLTAY